MLALISYTQGLDRSGKASRIRTYQMLSCVKFPAGLYYSLDPGCLSRRSCIREARDNYITLL